MNQNGGIHRAGFAVLCHRNGGLESPGILNQFVSDREQQEKYFSSIVNKNEFREEYKKNRKEIEEAIISQLKFKQKRKIGLMNCRRETKICNYILQR